MTIFDLLNGSVNFSYTILKLALKGSTLIAAGFIIYAIFNSIEEANSSLLKPFQKVYIKLKEKNIEETKTKLKFELEEKGPKISIEGKGWLSQLLIPIAAACTKTFRSKKLQKNIKNIVSKIVSRITDRINSRMLEEIKEEVREREEDEEFELTPEDYDFYDHQE